ncbi:septum formation initiator family protein [Rhodococcus sp. F64268]|uniref:FtsB family cell division protein n=1 Tax=Rhodococcus sp. F64268 TaxID=2926402 RepID=UPI001FF611F7|nr:septum formation initiator family protein [Rhodococcus sp. F64268]MCK0089705.1 septum formation initiator family protein [Rhodococcus sp. F64268]
MSQRGRSRPGARRSRTDGAAATRRPSRTRPSGSTAPADLGPETAGARPAGREDPVHSSRRGRGSTGRARPTRVGAPRDGRRPRTERTILGLSTGRAVILALVVCGLALTLAVPLRTYVSQRSEAEQIAQEREQLEGEIAALEAQKAHIEDPAWIRAEARNRLGFVMPGDIPYQVQLPGDVALVDEEKEPETPSTGAWYSDLWLSVVEPPPEPETDPVPQHMPVAPPEPGDIPG